MKHRSVLFFCACALSLFGCSESFESDGGGIRLMDSGTDGGSVDGGGGSVDGGGDPIDGGGGPIDGGGGPIDSGPRPDGGGAVGVDCMGTLCAPSQQCCVTMPGGGGAIGECIAAGATCAGATADCDGPEDCGGADVCCGRVGIGGAAIACETLDACMPGSFGPFELCHLESDCSTPSDLCCPIMMFGFSGAICQPMCFGGPLPGP